MICRPLRVRPAPDTPDLLSTMMSGPMMPARMPGASANPVLAELRVGKPCLKVLTKGDLADPEVTKAWLRHMESEGSGTVLAAAR